MTFKIGQGLDEGEGGGMGRWWRGSVNHYLLQVVGYGYESGTLTASPLESHHLYDWILLSALSVDSYFCVVTQGEAT